MLVSTECQEWSSKSVKPMSYVDSYDRVQVLAEFMEWGNVITKLSHDVQDSCISSTIRIEH